MAIIDQYSLILPLLKTIKDKEEYKLSEITDEVAKNTELTEKELSLKTPNGETLFASKLSTANMYSKKIGFIEPTKFMYHKITQKGLDLLEEDRDEITEEDLLKYPEFKEYKQVFTPYDIDKKDAQEDNSKLSAKSIFEATLKKNIEDYKEFEDKKNDKVTKKCGKCRKHLKISPAEELTKYADLLERGYLTKEEFDKKKEELLAIKY